MATIWSCSQSKKRIRKRKNKWRSRRSKQLRESAIKLNNRSTTSNRNQGAQCMSCKTISTSMLWTTSWTRRRILNSRRSLMHFQAQTILRCQRQAISRAAVTISQDKLPSQLLRRRMNSCTMMELTFWKKLTIRDSLWYGKRTKSKLKLVSTKCRL
jgi:hypothetical protein